MILILTFFFSRYPREAGTSVFGGKKEKKPGSPFREDDG